MGRYRHVYRRIQKSKSSGIVASTRWEIRHPEHGRITNFSAELAAAKHLAKLLHVEVANLKTRVPVSRSPRKFKYVFWHAGRKRWVAHPPGLHMTTCDASGSSFPSQDHAAEFVVRELGLKSVEELMNPRKAKRPLQESKIPESKACVQTSGESCTVARRYKYVFWHAREKKWVARPPQGCMTSCHHDGKVFKSEVDAAKFVVRELGLKSVADLKLKKSMSPGVGKAVSQYHGVVRHHMRWSAIVEQKTLGTFNLQVEAACHAM